MTRFIFSLCALVTVIAVANVAYASNADWCNAIANLSKSVMSSRQNGVPMVEIMKNVEKMESGRIKEIAKGMIMDAYASPAYSAAENKSAAIVEFQNEWYMECLKAK